jgi:DNA-binding XRE family transcriptional regulator
MNKQKNIGTTEPDEYAVPLVQALREERDRLLSNACRLRSHILELEGGVVENVFGRNVLEYRKLFGLSRQELAELLGIGRSMVSQIENGRHTTTIERLLQLCEVFKVTPNDLLL